MSGQRSRGSVGAYQADERAYLSRKEERVGLNILIMVNFEYLVDYFTEGKQILFL